MRLGKPDQYRATAIQRNGLLHNYLNETSSFVECSGMTAIAAATYRLSELSSNYSRNPSLTAAESAYRTLLNSHVSSPQGVLSPVVNPMDYSSQLTNVKPDASGNASPEGEAFVLLMESARRDWIKGGGDVDGLMASGTSAATLTRSVPSRLVNSIALVLLAGWFAT